MGKQIGFFMTVNDEKLIIQFIKKNDDLLINDTGKEIKELGEPVIYFPNKLLDKKIITKAFIKTSSSRILKCNSGFVDELFSEAIEFVRCEIRNNNELWNGRIWFAEKYYNDQGQIETKPSWLNKKYNIYKRWIKNNMRKSKTSDFYIGEDAYKLYKAQGFQMKNSPKVNIEFD